MVSFRLMFCAGICFGLVGCGSVPPAQYGTNTTLDGVTFEQLDIWHNSGVQDVLQALQKSCTRYLKQSDNKQTGLGLTASQWKNVCRAMPDKNAPSAHVKTYFETYFQPYRVTSNGTDEGLFTGYYEASLNGSYTQTKRYHVPLRARPQDLVMVNLGDFRPEFKGQRIAGRVANGQLTPYEDRQDIQSGKLPVAMDKPILWVDSAVDAFFLQVQGSGLVTLPDGRTQRIGYDGQNGHPYTAIGKELIARGALSKDNVSMQSIRTWLAENPDQAKDVMNINKSYVFFRELDTSGPLGAEGVELTPEVSLAIDSSIWPYGLPVLVDIKHPERTSRIQKVMIAQDTGGAIKGGVRGDFFWGYGDKAAHVAGLMKSAGRMWILLPKGSKPHLH